MEVEVVLSWILGDVLYPARQGDHFVHGLYKGTMHARHICCPSNVIGTRDRILCAVIDEARRILATKINDGRPLTHITVAITRVVDVRSN